MQTSPCSFCAMEVSPVLFNDTAVAVFDAFPVTRGHMLIVPRRHVLSLFDTTRAEREALFDLVEDARNFLVREFSPDGFNVGVNDGVAAGQTVMHLHIHLIPRYQGDTEDPRGGVRWIMPVKAPYWKRGRKGSGEE